MNSFGVLKFCFRAIFLIDNLEVYVLFYMFVQSITFFILKCYLKLGGFDLTQLLKTKLTANY